MTNSWLEVIPDPEIQALLDQYAQWGGVIQYVIGRAPGLAPPAASHHGMALFTMATLLRRHNEEVLQRASAQGLPPETFQQLRPKEPPTQQAGRMVDPAVFFGPQFDVNAGKLILRGRSPNYLNRYFYFDAEEKPATVIYEYLRPGHDHPYYQGFTKGYAGAFTDPPYGLSVYANNQIRTLPKVEVNQLFLALNQALFGSLATMQIYEWPTDWSPYFDAGHEWWGSFLWTLYNPSQQWMVGVAASTTD